ncbi:MAG TPA: hypothetical protein VJV78_20140 [Polyangiales bacterium]|nr:hypothetical protein [Polyangiales bacterium]
MLAAAVAALSCEEQASSGLAVVIESDLQLPKDIDRIRFEVTQNGASVRMEEHVLGPTGLLLPAEFRLQATTDASPVSIRVVGFKGPQPRIERGAITPIPSTYVAMLRMPLNFLCAGTARLDGSSSCGDMNTCKQGACASSIVGAAELPAYIRGPWSDAEGGMRDAATSDCFDVLNCFSGSYKPELNRQTCTFTLEQDDPGRISVAIKLPQGSDGICGPASCWVALDEGPEGWTQDGLNFTLPPTLCADRSDGTRFTIVVSNTCAGKTLNTPPCGDWSSASHPAEIEEPTGSTSSPNSTETPGEPVGTSCAGPSLQACGDCGMQRRTCRNGTWGEWGECTAQGVCEPNSSEACGVNGTRACEKTCEWGECIGQSCDGQSVEACGNCGTRRRSCANGAWSEWGPCLDQGECMPGTTQACGADGTQGCMGNCHWGVCGNQLCPGAPSQACGNCGTQTRSCTAATSTWSQFGVCEQEGSCEANSTRPCGTRGMQTCGGNCEWDAACTGQVCEGPATQVCGNCGIRTRSCDTNTGVWSEWSECTREGVCVPGQVQNCGAGGTQICQLSCQWSLECNGQACAGEMTQSCQRCGTQNRACDGNSATWLPWGLCLNQGPCNPGATRRCGSGGTQICQSDCNWGNDCTGQACSGPSSETCGNCGTRSHICNGSTGQFGDWTRCTGEGPCTPGDTESCGGNQAHTCTNQCRWGNCTCQPGFLACGTACVDPLSDPLHCGDCNTSCGERACNGGECESCPSGTHACNLECVSNSSINSCGNRCAPCAAPTNGTATCNGTQCDFRCNDGFHRCGNQCVSDTDLNSCGGRCNNPCPTPMGGSATCDGELCGSTCPGGTHNCNNQCVTNNSAATCGERCTPCPAPMGGSVSCMGGLCVPSCPAGSHLCGSQCVSDSDVNSCGDRCDPCPAGPTGSTASCERGECTYDCPRGQHACSGKCVSNNDVATCGDRCTPCPNGPTGSSPTCTEGTCNSTCNQGTRPCPGGACFANDDMHCGAMCIACSGGKTCNDTACVCPSGTHDCNGECESNTSVNSCGNRCDPCPAPKGGSATCSNNGTCGSSCPDNTHVCDGECVSSNSAATCGSSCTPCVAPVGGTVACVGGQCVPDCSNGEHLCGNTCVKNNDVNSCGDRCTPCPAGPNGSTPSCVNGMCQTSCPKDQHICDGKCVSDNDVDTCGDRCTPCPAGPTGSQPTCNNGVCSSSCSGNTRACTNPAGCFANDDDHCGASCAACTGGKTCNGTACVCPNGECNGVCVDTRSDKNNCGQCGKQCDSCSNGNCSCGANELACDSGCVPNDAKNCGRCDRACAPGVACIDGNCGCSGNQELCGGECVTCPRAPTGGTTKCEGASCVVDCGRLTHCEDDNSCSALNDEKHCGNCQTTCRGNENCVAGNCVAPEPPPQSGSGSGGGGAGGESNPG